MSLVNVYNEWDPLEEVIVGSASYARIPTKDKSFTIIESSAKDLVASVPSGILPEKIIEETEEDLAIFVSELEKLGIKVRRPMPIKFKDKIIKTIDWEVDCYSSYCPRDILMAFDNMIIESPGVLRSRYFETFGYKDTLIDYMQSGARWLSAPKPRLLDEIYDEDDNPELKWKLKNLEPVFDAANILRAGKDIFYLVSDSGNEMGYQWLKEILGTEYRVHPCHNLHSPGKKTTVHIDAIISLLRPGLALVNPSMITEDNLPSPLKKWEILVAPQMIEANYSNISALSSVWLGMNLLMLRPDLAVVDRTQVPLIKLLEQKGINVLPLILRHARVLGGSFHCITVDVRRKGKLEDYF